MHAVSRTTSLQSLFSQPATKGERPQPPKQVRNGSRPSSVPQFAGCVYINHLTIALQCPGFRSASALARPRPPLPVLSVRPVRPRSTRSRPTPPRSFTTPELLASREHRRSRFRIIMKYDSVSLFTLALGVAFGFSASSALPVNTTQAKRASS